MKISELIKLHGVPLKICHPGINTLRFYEIIGLERGGFYPAYTEAGNLLKIPDDKDTWGLYIEPTAKKKLYGYLAKESGAGAVSIFGDSYLVVLLPIEPTIGSFIKAPQFDCEV